VIEVKGLGAVESSFLLFEA